MKFLGNFLFLLANSACTPVAAAGVLRGSNQKQANTDNDYSPTTNEMEDRLQDLVRHLSGESTSSGCDCSPTSLRLKFDLTNMDLIQHTNGLETVTENGTRLNHTTQKLEDNSFNNDSGVGYEKYFELDAVTRYDVDFFNKENRITSRLYPNYGDGWRTDDSVTIPMETNADNPLDSIRMKFKVKTNWGNSVTYHSTINLVPGTCNFDSDLEGVQIGLYKIVSF